MNGKSMPFDVKRMLYGGFEVLVDASPSEARIVRRPSASGPAPRSF
jgi:hypothetical protein